MKVNDKRLNIKDNKEYEVFTFVKEEIETMCNYDYINDYWKVETNYQPHITKLLKLNNVDYTIDSVDENGRITRLIVRLSKKQISFRNEIVLTEEQREARGKALKNR